MNNEESTLPENVQEVIGHLKAFEAGLEASVAEALADLDDESKATEVRRKIVKWKTHTEKVRPDLTKPFRDMTTKIGSSLKAYLDRLEGERTKLDRHIYAVVKRRTDAEAAEAAETERLARVASDKLAEEARAEEETARMANDPEKRQEGIDKARALSEESLAKGAEADATAMAPRPVFKPKARDGTTTTFRKTFAFNVVDFGEVPDSFKTLNEGLVKKALQSGQTIPGITLKTGEEAQILVSR